MSFQCQIHRWQSPLNLNHTSSSETSMPHCINGENYTWLALHLKMSLVKSQRLFPLTLMGCGLNPILALLETQWIMKNFTVCVRQHADPNLTCYKDRTIEHLNNCLIYVNQMELETHNRQCYYGH